VAEWLYEAGIGEERAIRVEGGAIVAARVEWDAPLRAGLVADARVASKPAGARRGLVRFADGAEALIDRLPASVTEGETVRVKVTRAPLAERGRSKLAQAGLAPDASPGPAPSLREALEASGESVRAVRSDGPDFAGAGWDELVEEALTGEIAFPGGALMVSPTSAMTLIDVDGDLPSHALALAAVPAVAAALARLDLTGSVGIDFPTLREKRERQAVDAVLGEALRDWRGERTAMNGFGFVQLVSRRERPSLVARYANRVEAAARILLRRAERVAEPGRLLLTAAPPVRRAVRAEWEAELARRTGRTIVWREDPSLAPTAAFAQALSA
jgi:hypothetical protein